MGVNPFSISACFVLFRLISAYFFLCFLGRFVVRGVVIERVDAHAAAPGIWGMGLGFRVWGLDMKSGVWGL